MNSLHRHYSTVAELIDDARPHIDEHQEWRYGNDWKNEKATRAGLLAGEAPAEALAAYEIIRPKIDAAAALHTTDTGATRRRRRVWGEEGDEIDVARMLADSTHPWSRTIIGRSAPIVRLAINTALSCGNGPADFAETVAYAAAISDTLTTAGWSVEIIGMHASTQSRHARNEGKGTVYTWTVKGSGEPLDALRVLSLAAPGLCRAYCHGLLKRDTDDGARGICQMPADCAEIIGTPHVIGKHWNQALGYWREIDAAESMRQIIDANTTAQA